MATNRSPIREIRAAEIDRLERRSRELEGVIDAGTGVQRAVAEQEIESIGRQVDEMRRESKRTEEELIEVSGVSAMCADGLTITFVRGIEPLPGYTEAERKAFGVDSDSSVSTDSEGKQRPRSNEQPEMRQSAAQALI